MGGWAECFPPSALVETPSGAKDLGTVEVGDEVLTPSGFSEVVGFLHRDLEQTTVFLNVTTAAGSLVVSHAHLVQTATGYKQAQEIVPGDSVLYRSGPATV